MSRYFLELAYKGTNYSGFQIQENAQTIQKQVEEALQTIQREKIPLTGSSRTDAGVHARQNYFHFDTGHPLHPQLLYKLNAILPPDIAVKNILAMPPEAHCRFDAIGREYEYSINQFKDPFLQETAYYYPYKLNIEELNKAAAFIKIQQNFQAFSKTNTQVKNFMCTIHKSEWYLLGDRLVYHIIANRFLRGMVRLLTGTQLKIARGNLKMQDLESLFRYPDTKAIHSVPPKGLILKRVIYPDSYFQSTPLAQQTVNPNA
jgi:tRNA pseudouridine38-40 synthase